MTASQRTLRSIGSLFRSEETLVIEFTGVVDDDAFGRVETIVELLRSAGGVDEAATAPSGPAYVAGANRSNDSAYVFVDAKHTGPDQVQGLVEILSNGADDAGLGLRLPDGTRRFDDIASASPVLILSAFEAVDMRLRDESAVPAVAPIVISTVLGLVADPVPSLMVGGIDIPSSRSQLMTQVDHTGANSLWFRAGADGLFADAQVFYSGQVRVVLAGQPLLAEEQSGRFGDQLAELARVLPGPPSGSVIRPDLSVQDAPLGGSARSLEDARRRTTSRVAAPDEAAVGVGWSQTMSASLWKKISCANDLVDSVDLDDGRVEVTIGSVTDWAPGQSEPSEAQTLAFGMFEPVLVTRDDWTPIARAHNERVHKEREAIVRKSDQGPEGTH